jgi:CubicO group peptidase (beta-lactamase class C family)
VHDPEAAHLPLATAPSEPARDLSAAAALVVERLRAAPCAVVAAARRDGRGWRLGVGAAGSLSADEGAARATAETYFDLASLTKPVTALALARLERRGLVARRERLADALPEIAGTASAEVPIDLLAAHRGGLDGHRPLYAPLVDGRPVDRLAALREAAEARRAGCEGPPPAEGFAPVYSDLGYLLVGAALAARGGDDVDRLMEREVAAPLGLAIGSARGLRARDPRFDERVAPTEVVAWRGGVVRGAVHDENAWAIARDAAAGHAGLFGDAASVARLGAAILDALAGRTPGWLEPDDLAPLVRDRPGGSLLAGFDRRSGDAPSSGARFGARTFGHLGFTGTSVWMDPDAGLVGVLLTNRVHPTRAADAIRRARPAAYDAIVELMSG